MSKFILGSVLIAAIIVVAFFVKGHYLKKQVQPAAELPLQSQIPSPQEDRPIAPPERPTTGDTDNSQTVAAIKKGFTTGDIALYIGAFIDNQGATITSFGATEEKTDRKTVANKLESYFKNAAGPWNFSATSSAVQKLIQKDPDNFKDAIVGTSADGHAVSFKLNSNFMIEKIFMVVNYNVLLAK